VERVLNCFGVPERNGTLFLSLGINPPLTLGFPTTAQLATGMAVQGSNPGGGEIFDNLPYLPLGPPSLLYNAYRVFPGGRAAGAWR
jgi:hypothetical protein